MSQMNDKKKIIDDINSDEDFKDMAPSLKQYDALKLFKDKKNVLDYGCGSGCVVLWRSISQVNCKK